MVIQKNPHAHTIPSPTVFPRQLHNEPRISEFLYPTGHFLLSGTSMLNPEQPVGRQGSGQEYPPPLQFTSPGNSQSSRRANRPPPPRLNTDTGGGVLTRLRGRNPQDIRMSPDSWYWSRGGYAPTSRGPELRESEMEPGKRKERGSPATGMLIN